jgi:hypothetical protein
MSPLVRLINPRNVHYVVEVVNDRYGQVAGYQVGERCPVCAVTENRGFTTSLDTAIKTCHELFQANMGTCCQHTRFIPLSWMRSDLRTKGEN